jgi:hypothetical protein
MYDHHKGIMKALLRNIFIFSVLLAPAVALAQAVPAPVEYAVAPQVPGPGQAVTIQMSGVGDFLGSAQVTWTRDGKVVEQGTGISTFDFTAPGLGQTTTISVEIDSDTQGSITNSWTFTPSLVSLLWEADTTVPPFYLGKPLYSAGSPLTVVAFPTVYSGGKLINASALSYQWSIGDQPATTQSGLGRYAISYTGDQLQNNEDVSVDVYYGNAEVGHAEVIIPATQPQLLLYQRDPLRGLILDSALPAGISLGGAELTVQAEPYYFSTASKQSGTLTYDWQLDGTDITGPDSAQGILTLRQTGSGQGNSNLTASLQDENSNTFVQSAQTALEIVFGQQQSSLISNLFGL